MIKRFFASRKYHILILLVGFFILTRFEIDPDLGWHIVYGQKFLESGEIIRKDTLSWTMPGYSWGNSYFLYQVLVAFLFDKFGHILTALVFGLIAASALLFLLPKKLDFAKVLVVFLGVAVALANLGVRPHLFSFWFFSLLLFLLDKRFYRSVGHVLFWFLFFTIWANIHRGFLVGLVVLAVYILMEILIEKSQKKKISILSSGLLCIFAGFGATLANPFNLKLWQSAVFLDLTSKDNLLSIAEWHSTVLFTPINLIFGLSAVLFIYVLHKNFEKVDPKLFLISCAIFMFSFLAAAFLFFWAAIFIYLMSRNFSWNRKIEFDSMAKIPIIFSFICVVVVLILNSFVNFLESYNLEHRFKLDGYPVEAVRYLRERGNYGRLFNEYAWGGYIDWQAKEFKVFIDGRMASWLFDNESSILGDYMAITGQKDCSFVDRYEIKTVLISTKTNDSCFDSFGKIYEDATAKVLVRN